MSAPSPVPMPSGYEQEVGGGVMLGDRLMGRPLNIPIANAQLWYRKELNPRRQEEIGGLFQAGFPAMLSGGAFYRRAWPIEDEAVRISHQIDGGLLWVGYGIPMAFRLSETLWLTLHPTFRYSMLSIVHVPIGLGWQADRETRLDFGAGFHGLHLDADGELQGNQMLYGAVSLSRHW